MPAGYPLQVRLQLDELNAVDEYRRAQTNPPSRGEAVRRLTRAGLKHIGTDESSRKCATASNDSREARP
jgi:hypothetical protein